jgi:hypothetical protein
MELQMNHLQSTQEPPTEQPTRPLPDAREGIPNPIAQVAMALPSLTLLTLQFGGLPIDELLEIMTTSGAHRK